MPEHPPDGVTEAFGDGVADTVGPAVPVPVGAGVIVGGVLGVGAIDGVGLGVGGTHTFAPKNGLKTQLSIMLSQQQSPPAPDTTTLGGAQE